jgi:hypothetical protein
MYHGDMATAGYAGLVGFYKLAERLGSPYQRDLAAYLLARNAVPMAAKFGFLDYARGMVHQEAQGGTPCVGFGEVWAASFPAIRPEERGYGPGDVWWHTGCIGPQSAQPEVLDLLMRRCRQDLTEWEQAFQRACPDDLLVGHDEIRVPPHILLRAYLGGPLRQSAEEVAKSWRNTYLLRDAHVAASLLAWDCPVRLVDWSPAYVESARWDAEAQAARITLDAGPSRARVRWCGRGKPARVRVDGQTARPVPAGQEEEWSLLALEVAPGRHELVIERIGE